MICLITRNFFKDAVLASDGHTYDRDTITIWLVKSKKSLLTNEVLDNSILNGNITVRKLLTNLAARAPQEVDIINTQEVININIQLETIIEGHALRHESNDLSLGHASQQEPIRSDTFNLISLNILP